ncbi:MAG: PGF-pre-PGF domain-containing protein [Methanosarcina sp.]
MKADFFSFLIYILVIILIIPGMTPNMASAVGETLSDGGNSDTGNSSTGNSDTGNSDTGNSDTGNSDTGNSDTGNSDTGNSDTGNSQTGNSQTGNSQTGNSDTGNSGTDNSHNGNLDTGNSDIGDSQTGNSKTKESITENSKTEKSITGNSKTKESITENSKTEKSITGNSHTVNSSNGNSSTGEIGGNGSSSSSSSSSGLGLVSREPASNIYAKELVTRSVMGGYPVRFYFVENVTCVTDIEFDPTMTFRKTTTIAEVLKNKSIFVPELPTGRIYKHFNIWVGDKGAGLPTSLRNGFIGFRVEKTWIKDNNVNESLLTLQWYEKGWQPLRTEKVREDKNYVYFKAEVSGFSCFAITEYAGNKENIKGLSIAEKLQDTLRILGGKGNAITIGSEKKGNSKIENPMGLAKILMAISLPLFMVIIGYLVLKKKI